MTSSNSLTNNESLEELKQQRYHAALALDLNLVSQLNKQINNHIATTAANKVPNQSVVTRRIAMVERATGRQREIIPVEQRVALTMVELGLRSVQGRRMIILCAS
ncbi:hypothetical protein [Aeromonas rivipollensis]|uniref:hypothetical protein n=1 Tax=Aeromonas rivipollensis TaxID=948519 RepID=UPI003D1B097E